MLVQHPDVLEAGVVAVPDSHWGERPKVYITLKDGKSLRPEALIEWAKSEYLYRRFQLARYLDILADDFVQTRVR
jgi:acyl-coenzyme A synthetase/AMP-(fatty) acid ligase